MTAFYIIGALLVILIGITCYQLGESNGEIKGFDKCTKYDNKLLELQRKRIEYLYYDIEKLKEVSDGRKKTA